MLPLGAQAQTSCPRVTGTTEVVGSAGKIVVAAGQSCTIASGAVVTGTKSTFDDSGLAVDVKSGSTLTIEEGAAILWPGTNEVSKTLVYVPNSQINPSSRVTVVIRGTVASRSIRATGVLIEASDSTLKVEGRSRIEVLGSGGAGIELWGSNLKFYLRDSASVRTSGKSEGRINAYTVNFDDAAEDQLSGGLLEMRGRATVESGDGGAEQHAVNVRRDGITVRVLDSAVVRSLGDRAHAIYFRNGTKGEDFTAGTEEKFARIEVRDRATVEAHGADAHAVRVDGDNVFITVGGRLLAHGGGHAILGHGNDKQTLTLLSTATVLGRVDLGGGADVLKFGEGDGAVEVAAGQTVFAARPSGLISQTVTVRGIGGATDAAEPARIVMAEGSTGPSLLRAMAGDASQAVQTAVSHQALSLERARGGWVSVGSESRRQKNGLEHRRRNTSLVAGLELAGAPDADWQLGLAAGIWSGRTSTGASLNTRAQGSGFAAGPYIGYSFDDITVSGSLLFGRNSYKTRRGVLDTEEGNVTALGSSKGSWFGAAFGASSSHALNPTWSLRPRLLLSWTRLSQGGYAETGTTNSNLKGKSRSDRVIGLDGELGVARAFAEGRGELELRAGFVHMRRSGDGASLTLGDETVSTAVDGISRETDIRMGVGVSYALDASSGLDFAFDYGRGKQKASGVSAALAYRVAF